MTRHTQRAFPGTGAGALLALCAGTASWIAGCAASSTERPTVVGEAEPPAYNAPPAWDPGDRPVSELLASARPPSGQAALVSTQRLNATGADDGGVAPGGVEPDPGELIGVRLAVSGAEVRDVMQALLGEYLGRSIVLDPGVTGTVSIDVDEQMARSEVMDLAGAVGSLFGLAMDERDGVIYIRPMAKAARSPDAPILRARPGVESEFSCVRVRKLRHLVADQLTTLLRDFTSEGGKIAFVGRTLVMADTARQVSRLSSLVSALDVPAFHGVEVWTYHLVNRPPEDAAKTLEAITTGTAIGGGTEPLVAYLPIPGTKRLLVISRDPSLQPIVTDFVRQADQPRDAEQRGRYVYRVQHYPTSQLLVLVRDFLGERMEKTPGEGAGIRIIADAQSDLLLLYATPSDFAEVVSVLRAVDRPAQQVDVRSIIAEVRLANRLQYGVEYFLETSTDLGELALTGLAPLAESAIPTGTAFFVGADGFAIIQALDRESDARVLSQPRMLIRDRDTASIQVGGEVPVLKASEGASTDSGGTSNIREEIEYRQTGVILTVQPEINESGLVTLKIDQEVNDALPTDVPNQPEFTTRRLETTVVVPHGKTVLLGGIINEDRREEQNRIPILGRIPIAGEAFKNRNNTAERTELILAITPTIVNDPSQAPATLSDFLRSTFGVRAALHEFAQDLPPGALDGVAPEGLENQPPTTPTTPPTPAPPP
ncbi:MAG TPA: hypothetical protein DEB06_10170, partial [Phycisphaerales bacterium]|nr:hypothetical protein [Phycisphaerales bacterium]